MHLKKLVEMVGAYMARFFQEKFSGRVVMTFHFNQGGIGKTEVEIKHDLEKWFQESDTKELQNETP